MKITNTSDIYLYITILGRKKSRNMCENAFSLVYKGLECVDLQDRNIKQMYDQLKRRNNSQRINSLLFLKFLLNLILKNKC